MRKTAKLSVLTAIITFVITLTLLSCATDRYNADGRIIKLDGRYYRMNNTVGNAYILEPVVMDTIIMCK